MIFFIEKYFIHEIDKISKIHKKIQSKKNKMKINEHLPMKGRSNKKGLLKVKFKKDKDSFQKTSSKKKGGSNKIYILPRDNDKMNHTDRIRILKISVNKDTINHIFHDLLRKEASVVVDNGVVFLKFDKVQADAFQKNNVDIYRLLNIASIEVEVEVIETTKHDDNQTNGKKSVEIELTELKERVHSLEDRMNNHYHSVFTSGSQNYEKSHPHLLNN